MAQFIDPFPGMKPGEKLGARELARAIRQAIAAEHEAVHLYEAIADATDNKNAKDILQDIANEEKVHVGELQSLLESIQPDEKEHVDEGRDEVKDKLAAWLSKNLRLS
jgi:rubrerythrin